MGSFDVAGGGLVTERKIVLRSRVNSRILVHLVQLENRNIYTRGALFRDTDRLYLQIILQHSP